MSETKQFAKSAETTPRHAEVFSANLCGASVPSASLSLFPWEDIDLAVREQAEAEIWSDAEHDAWLAALMADDTRSLTGSDPAYDRWVAEGAPSVVWSSLADDDAMADVWPAEYRDDWVGM